MEKESACVQGYLIRMNWLQKWTAQKGASNHDFFVWYVCMYIHINTNKAYISTMPDCKISGIIFSAVEVYLKHVSSQTKYGMNIVCGFFVTHTRMNTYTVKQNTVV